MMQPLFQVWGKIAADLKTAPHVLLLSDYDGTLTPIVSRPEEALLSPEVREKFRLLAQKPWLSVGIVSGRSLAEVKKMVDVPGIFYAGNHGFEIEGPGINFTSPVASDARITVNNLVPALKAELGNIEGIIVEDKGMSLSVHYRLVKDSDFAAAETAFREVTEPLIEKGEIRVTTGKKVWEVRPPVDWDKGKAVETIRGEIQKTRKIAELTTVYLGDDTTDEDAFRVLRPPDGLGIFIGGERPSSGAAYYLESPADVAGFLSRLLELR